MPQAATRTVQLLPDFWMTFGIFSSSPLVRFISLTCFPPLQFLQPYIIAALTQNLHAFLNVVEKVKRTYTLRLPKHLVAGIAKANGSSGVQNQCLVRAKAVECDYL